MSKSNRHTTYPCNAGNGTSQVNLTKYKDKNGKDNYVTQFKKDGKEVFHVTTHADGNVYLTDKNGKTKLR